MDDFLEKELIRFAMRWTTREKLVVYLIGVIAFVAIASRFKPESKIKLTSTPMIETQYVTVIKTQYIEAPFLNVTNFNNSHLYMTNFTLSLHDVSNVTQYYK